MNEEYSLEIRKGNGDFVQQVDVFNTYEEAQIYADTFPVSGDFYYSIWCIEYDDKGEEIQSYPVY